MAPPPMTTNFQLSSDHEPLPGPTSLVIPTTTSSLSKGISDDRGKKKKDALTITAVENDITCSWYSGAKSQPLECSPLLTCTTYTGHIIACSKKNEKSSFYSSYFDYVKAIQDNCTASGVLCRNSVDRPWVTLAWTASPTRSLVGCHDIPSTWAILDYPLEGDKPTPTSSSDAPTLASSSSKSAPPSDTHKPPATPPATSGPHSSESDSSKPSSSSVSSFTSSLGGDTVPPAPGSGFSTYTVTTPTATNSASLLPVSSASSVGLPTDIKAGIGVGASAGLLIVLALIVVLILKKRQARPKAQSEERQNDTGGPLQDNPSGDLPADIAPPARLARSPSGGWIGNGNIDFDMTEGASEVPVGIRGQGVSAVELPGSPVEMASITAAQNQFDEYQAQASQYRRYSQLPRNPQGIVSYRGPLCESTSPWSGSPI